MRRGRLWWSGRDGALLVGLCLVAGVLFMLLAGVPWLGSWKMALDWASGSAMLIGPVVAGLTAWRYSRIAGLGLAALAGQTPRGTRAWLAPAVVTWSVACGAVLLIAVVATSLALLHGSVAAPRQAVVLVLGCSVLAAQVLVGAFAGTRFPGPWAPPVAAVLVFCLTTFSSTAMIPETFRTGGVTGPLVGEVYVPSTILAQASVALALAAILLHGVRSRIAPTVSRATAVTTALAVALGAVCWAGGAASAERYRFVPVPLVCDDGGRPEVCVARETSRPLSALAAALREAAAPLRAAHVDLPARWEPELPLRPHPEGAGVLTFFDDGETSGGADRAAVLASLAAPAACAELRSSSPDLTALQAQAVLTRWLDLASRPGRSDGGELDTWLVTDEATAWAARSYAALSSCSLADLRLPAAAPRWGG
ncbi:hypothetical protein [Nocardioides humi]|uniref:Uncharacterized protein n=1 Tax=Nocardioides humi TaxID=449461 RepID=A0ABN2B0A9_9ACTN|nr:hypothetical protein [Nocardioides humi]